MNRAVTHYCRRSVTTLTCLLVLAGCSSSTAGPEDQLRQWVGAAEQAAQDKERGELMDMISAAYTDARGNGRDDIEKMLRLYFFRQNSIKLLTSIEEIRLYDDSAAEMEVTVGMAGMNDGVLGFSADAYRFEFELENVDDQWLLISARWSELGVERH
jgi:hypothetical protein